MKALIAKTLNDIFVEKMDTSMGFTVDFKETCEIISTYYMVCRNVENQEDFSKAFLELFSGSKPSKTGHLLPGTHQHGG